MWLGPFPIECGVHRMHFGSQITWWQRGRLVRSCARQMAKEGRRGLTENGFGLSRDCGALDRSMMLRIAPHRSSQRHPGSGPASEPEGDGV